MKNRPKISVFIASSIDSFIARENSDMDWLDKFSSLGEDYGFYHFFGTIDTIIIGRNTYETACSVPNWPYPGKRVIVLSHTLESVIESCELYKGDVALLIEKLQSEGVKHIWADGGVVVMTFLKAKMVDEMTVTIAPVVLGGGIPLFHRTMVEEDCRLLQARTFPSGMVQLSYSFKR